MELLPLRTHCNRLHGRTSAVPRIQKRIAVDSVAGYAAATATGVMRILNRRHWLSDVVTGAGIGIASVEIAYLLLPVFNRWIYGKKEETTRRTSMMFAPAVGYGYYGAGFACVF